MEGDSRAGDLAGDVGAVAGTGSEGGGRGGEEEWGGGCEDGVLR